MSLTLIQGYSSAEEEEERKDPDVCSDDSSSEEGDGDDSLPRIPSSYNPILAAPKPFSDGGSALPSALEAFSEVSGPPQFLNNCVEEPKSTVTDSAAFRGRRKSRDKKNLPPGAVVESNAQLVGIHERVRSDIQSSTPTQTLGEGGKRVSTAANPGAEDASQLLRMCLQCGVPKTYTSARGIVCPLCGDRPPNDGDSKKKGSTIKDKEKSKRMRGQSSHSSWKSETEMQLRQQFD